MATTGTRKAAATRYKKKLDALFGSVSKERLQLLQTLTRRAAFLLATEDELEALIQEEGPVGVYDNGGGQSGVNVSAYLKSYALANQQLLATFKQLKDFLPEESDAGDELALFIKQHKK